MEFRSPESTKYIEQITTDEKRIATQRAIIMLEKYYKGMWLTSNGTRDTTEFKEDVAVPAQPEWDSKVRDAEPEYQTWLMLEHRKASYIFVENQIDMIFKDIDAGFFGEDAKNGSFYKFIKEIKDTYPKP